MVIFHSYVSLPEGTGRIPEIIGKHWESGKSLSLENTLGKKGLWLT